jgi:hypothetical protein
MLLVTMRGSIWSTQRSEERDFYSLTAGEQLEGPCPQWLGGLDGGGAFSP